MRFKDQARREEQRALLRNQQVNRQYEEKCSLWSSTTKITSNAQRTEQKQAPQQRPRWPLSISPDPAITSVLPVRAAYPQSPTGVSSGDDADSLSDLEYNESSPLLGQDDPLSDREEEEDSSDDCNHNSEEDSMFSDSSCDMSESKTGTGSSPPPLSLDNCFLNGNNNNNRNYLTTTTTRPSSASGALDRGERVFRDTVQPLLQPVHVRPAAPMKMMVPPLPAPPPPQLDSPMSEGSEELDVNLASDPDLNDVSLGKSGINGLLSTEETNITSGDDEEEAKILNVLLCEEGNRRDIKESDEPEPADRADTLPEAPSVPPAVTLGDFDVYTIETAMPTIDWAAMEAHLAKSAKENDWMRRRRNDREEIRRKLAMDSDSEEYYCGERVPNGKKPSLTTRLQSGMNLQICFMNETASDLDSQSSDHDYENGNSRIPPSYGPVPAAPSPVEPVPSVKESLSDQRISALLDASLILDTSLQHHSSRQHNNNRVNKTSPLTNNNPTLNGEEKCQRPSFFFNRQRSWRLRSPKDKKDIQQNEPQAPSQPETPFDPREDFVTRHARLQAEARHALAQAKEMARMQMEVERQRKKKSPIADIVGIPFADGWHRLSRHVLTDMNVAQLQVIVNDLHSQIESLNEDLVRLLLERDDLHMEQDSMLVDIEDLTRYLGAKDDNVRSQPLPSQL